MPRWTATAQAKRLDGTRKLGQHPIADRLDDATLVFGNLRIGEFAAVGWRPREGAGLILPHQPAISGDIGGKMAASRRSTRSPLIWPAGPAE